MAGLHFHWCIEFAAYYAQCCLIQFVHSLSIACCYSILSFISTYHILCLISARIDVVLVVRDIIVMYRKNETILILISLKRYFLHPE